MAVPVFNSWAFIWTFLGFALILAGTSIDRWTETIQRYQDFVYPFTTHPTSSAGDGYIDGPPVDGVYFKMPVPIVWNFGTLDVDYRYITTTNYASICPSYNKNKTTHKHEHQKILGDRARDINKTSAGMIAMLLLSNTVCFIASFLTILGCSRSSIGGNFTSARLWSIFAFITAVVTWALWLRAHQEFLNQKNHGCRFPYFPRLDVTVGASFGLYIVGTFLYLVLIAQVTRIVTIQTNTNAPGAPAAQPASSRFIIFVAFAAFAAIFVASIDNQWSRASSTTFEQQVQNAINADIGSYTHYDNDYDGEGHSIVNKTAKNGVTRIYYVQEFGVYTASEVLDVYLPYNDVQNQDVICGTERFDADGYSFLLVQGGRVTLGFAITATILSFFAALLQMNDNRSGFWLSTAALACCVVSLIVWGVTADYVIRSKCCYANTCVLGDSYGLIAAGAALLTVAIFYQAWVLQNDVYVLPAHAYGMASQFETELQGV